MKLLIGIVIAIVVYFAAIFISRSSKKISKAEEFYTDVYFDKNHRELLNKLIENGSSEKNAYEIIIANQDTEILNKHRLVIFWFILTMLLGSGLLSEIL